MGLNLIMNLVLVQVFHLGHVGLAATTGILALVNFAQLAWCLRHSIAFGSATAWGQFTLRTGLASLLCGLGAWAAANAIRPLGTGTVFRLAAVTAGVLTGGALFAAFALLVRVPEAASAWRFIARRLPGLRADHSSGT
jgi:putative peptidoglycan lipid II flippase